MKTFEMKKPNAFFLLLFVLGFFSCTNVEKKQMATTVSEVNALISTGQFESLTEWMDSESMAFYEAMTEKDNINFDSLYEIGQTFKVPYGALTYLMDFGRYMRSTEDPSDFFKFLVLEQISYFNPDGVFQVEESKMKTGSEYMMGLSREKDGKKSLTWMKLSPQPDGTFKWNMMYNIRLHEYQFMQYYADARENVKEKSAREWLTLIYEQTGENNIQIEDINRRIMKKREAFSERKGVE